MPPNLSMASQLSSFSSTFRILNDEPVGVKCREAQAAKPSLGESET
jgi:hypothetical protein